MIKSGVLVQLTIVVVGDVESALGGRDDSLVRKVVGQRLSRNCGPYNQ